MGVWSDLCAEDDPQGNLSDSDSPAADSIDQRPTVEVRAIANEQAGVLVDTVDRAWVPRP